MLAARAPAVRGDEAQAATPPIAATINGEPVFVAELNTVLSKVRQVRGPNVGKSAQAQADLLKQVINRRLVAQMLKREGGYYTDEEINKALDTVKTQADAEKLTVEQLAAREGASLDAWRQEAIWQVGWTRYLERHLTDQLESYFNGHRTDFDGTQVRASHILLRAERSDESSEQLTRRAEKIRAGIEAGKITFEEAAQRFSAGPSRAHGGDLGFFPRHGVMFEDFGKAAFALEKGRISEPIVSPFGVHLVRVTDIKPGSKQWTEVVDQMRQPASIELFDNLAAKESENSKIEFTGVVPYFKPGTDEIVLPGGAAN